MATKKARNILTLKRKCELIDVASRALAEKFGCGKTKITKILSKRESLVEQMFQVIVFC